VFEVLLVLLVAWATLASKPGAHARGPGDSGVGNVLVVISVGVCLVLFLAVLVYWQWRQRPVGRVRLLLAMFVSLVWSLCGLAWYDTSRAVRHLEPATGAAGTREWLMEATLASGISLSALIAGLAAVVAILVVERRALNPPL
jgi:hypothetical protein